MIDRSINDDELLSDSYGRYMDYLLSMRDVDNKFSRYLHKHFKINNYKLNIEKGIFNLTIDFKEIQPKEDINQLCENFNMKCVYVGVISPYNSLFDIETREYSESCFVRYYFERNVEDVKAYGGMI